VKNPVYVVLVNYNGWRNTVECLESLLRSDYPALRVLVLDNGSTDGSLARLRGWSEGADDERGQSASLAHLSTPPVRKPVPIAQLSRAAIESGTPVDWRQVKIAIIDCAANLGFAGANNVAFRYVMSREPDSYLLMLNNDTVVAPTAISALVATAEADAGYGAVGATLLQYHAPDRIETFGGAMVDSWNGLSRLRGWGTARSAPREPSSEMDFISGCCMLVPHAALGRVGLIDERFFLYCEDADWGLRVRQAELRLTYSPAAEVWHKGGATAVHRSEFHDYHNVKSVLHFVRKHRPVFLPVAVAYLAARFTLPKIARGEWRRLRPVWRGFADFVREARRNHASSESSGARAARA
jgi:GT2 family glycosyltransferase